MPYANDDDTFLRYKIDYIYTKKKYSNVHPFVSSARAFETKILEIQEQS